MKKNQLTRALRVDKMTIAALESTLKLYLDEKTALEEIPTLNMISVSKEKLMEKAEKFSEMIRFLDFDIELIEDRAEVGGGSFPAVFLESIAVRLTHKSIVATELEERLLMDVEIPVITRIKENSIILDMRTLREEEFSLVQESLRKITE